VRRPLIQHVLPLVFCLMPLLAAVLVALAAPSAAMQFYLDHVSPMDLLILTLGGVLFLSQILLAWRALQWRGTAFDERPDRWITNLAQAAEWFPLLGLLGTVGGILQTFGNIRADTSAQLIIQMYAPAITATGSGLFMALINILPAWVVLLGRDLILTLGGGEPSAPGTAKP
jgi:MotA/TolQ/ExbB proton channel family protein